MAATNQRRSSVAGRLDDHARCALLDATRTSSTGSQPAFVWGVQAELSAIAEIQKPAAAC
jgi:hypothetical protein